MSATANKIPEPIAAGDNAPAFSLPADDGTTLSLSSCKGKKLVLYFYPKDDTPGCTLESRDFAQRMEAFSQKNTVILGVSRDSIKSHTKFKEKYCLPFLLLSDTDGDMCEAYGVWVEKSMYGKKYMGIERTTFLIDPSGKIARVWNKVKVDGHAEEVLQAAGSL